MAFEQILGRENFETVVEIREIPIQKDRKHNAEGEQGKSLAHNNNNKVICDKKREGELLHADNTDRSQDKEATREREGEGKFEMKGDSERSRVEKERRNKEDEEARAEEAERFRLEAVNKYRAKAMQKRMDIIASTEQKAKRAAAASDDHQEKELEAKENTERKKDKSERKSSETKTESKEGASPKSFKREEQQEGIGKPGAVGQVPQKDTKISHESKTVERFEGIQERDKGTKMFTTYADVVKGSVARKEEEPYKDIAGSKGCDEGEKEETEDGGVVLQMEKNPLIDNNYFYPTDTEGGGRYVFGAVGETVKEIIVETVMKPAEKVMMQKGEEEEEEEEGKGGGGGVLRAIGETVAEIAETTKGIVVREGKTESRQSTWSEAF